MRVARELHDEVGVAVVPVAQSALTNIQRHARARKGTCRNHRMV